jgi:acetyl esterase/lipase
VNIRRFTVIAFLAATTLLGCTLPGVIPVPEPSEPPGEGPPGEVEVAFVADRIVVQPGECATLEWSVEGGFGVELNGQPVERTGQAEVCPEETTSYTLDVDAGNTMESRQVIIFVGSPEGSPPAGPPTEAPPATSVPPMTGEVTVYRDLEYASYGLDGAEHKLLLDLYLPDGSPPQPLPLLVFIHGGGWIEGSKDTCPGTSFAQNGYAMACVDYRLSDIFASCPTELVFPAQIYDVKAAVRWLRSHAEEYGFDPERFGAIGDSSGGHLAALLGTSDGVADLQGPENLGMSDGVQAVADWYGPIDITQGPMVFQDDLCEVGLEHLNATYGGEETQYFYWTTAWGAFLGGSLVDPEVLEEARRATPLTYIDAQDPPFLVIHGEDDGMVPIAQSESLVAALSAAGVEVTFLRISGLGHGFVGPSGQGVDPAVLDPTLDFFDTHLKAP